MGIKNKEESNNETKLFKKKNRPSNKKDNPQTSLKAPNKLKLLFTIVDRSKAEFYIDYLENFEINLQTVIYGRGTAPRNIDYLSIAEQNKAVIISVINDKNTKDIINGLEEKFLKVKHGKGVAYTIPISSMIGVLIYQYLSNNQEYRKESI